MPELKVSAASGEYPIVIEQGGFAHLGARIDELAGGSAVLIIADQNTAALLPRQLAVQHGRPVFRINAGEQTKTLTWVEKAATAAAVKGLDRGSLIVAVGGGVVGDLAGVVAATYMRGVRLMQVPTTLLAMVDSSIGGKAAVNLRAGKNLVGAFKPPIEVFIDPDVLSGLPDREFRSGLAEVLKYSMIADEQLYDSLLANRKKVLQKDIDLLTDVITICCAIKAGVVTRDEQETGERAILNYGHTFGHALEAATAYRQFTHGEAISVGMEVAAQIGFEVGVTPGSVIERQGRLLDAYKLPRKAPGAATVDAVMEAIRHDKKGRAGVTPWVLLDRLGHAVFGHKVNGEVAEHVIGVALKAA
ncbi:MAG TPA: 3-dehydroquinate synthase [Candidatus Solibacter sp.]|nr:3-dehydroquinate synthase [Candidatus Solibacter sp.]